MELENTTGSSRGSRRNRGAKRDQVDKRNMRCYRWGKPGHFSRECRGGRKQNNVPEADPESRGERQASNSGKAGRS